VALYVLRVPLIQVLLQRGAFDVNSTLMVAYALQFYAIGLLGHAVVEIAVRGFYAMHNTWTPVLVGVGAMALNVVFSLWWVHFLSFGGLALANSVATTLEMFVLLWLLRRRMGGIELRRLLSTMLRCGFSALVMGVVAWWWLQWLPGAPVAVDKWGVALSSLVICAAVYLLLVLVLGSEELRAMVELVRRRRPIS
jgi:putative peptidoglycan lipid II flippase